nr:efflux RND transporter permease subunit [Negativicutes bacterium]
MAKFFIDRPIFAIVVSIFIVLGGLIAGFNLPIAQYPQITPPTINVSANYNGANAEVVEQSIAQVIELQVNGTEGMVTMDSTSADNGVYSLNVKFELGKDADLASVQTQNRVTQANAQLPTEVTSSGIVTKKATPDRAMIFALWSPNGTYDRGFMKNYGSIYLVEELKRVKGVGTIQEFGSDYAMRIWLQPDKMAQLGVTTTAIAAALKDQNVQAPVGAVGQNPSAGKQDFQYTARVKGRMETPEEFGQIIIRSQSDGSIVRIKDVARIEMADKDYLFAAFSNGMPSVGFSIQLASDANALDTIRECSAILERASQSFPADMKYGTVVDNTRFVRESLIEVAKTFFEALLLVMLIVFIFLQSWRATLIPMLAVPVSLLGTFGAFLLMGFSINTLTLFAMVLAIGLVVDDAIVVVEAVEYHMRFNGLPPREATYKAMEDVSGPIVAIAFVLASVFIPVAFFGGTVGVLYKQFALTIAVSMALSAVVALSLTPALCAMLLQPHDPHAHKGKIGHYLSRFTDWFERLRDRYERGAVKVLFRAKFSLLLMPLLLVMAWGISGFVPSSFVPSEDQGYFVATVSLPEAASMKRTEEVANKIAEEIRKMPGVKQTMIVTGIDMLAGANKSSAAVIFTELTPWKERTAANLSVDNIVRNVIGMASRIPEANTMAFNVPPLPGIGSLGGFSFILQDRSGHTPQELDEATKTFLAEARKRPEIAMIYSTFRTDTPGYKFDVDREKAKKLGVPVSGVFNTLQAFLGGLQVNDFNRFGRTYKVVMQADAPYRQGVEDLRTLYVESNTGVMIPLSTLVQAVPVNNPTAFKRFNGFRSVLIGGSPAPGYSSGQVIQALEEVAAQSLPQGYSYEWADQSREEKVSGGRTPILFGLALL